MPDKLEVSIDNQGPDATRPSKDEIPETPQTQEELEKIFEERFDLFMSQLSERIEEEHVPVAIAIIVDPKYPATPMIFKTGHIYDQARLLANVLRVLRIEMNKELST